jgi:predicted amidohydrolase YtcJ
VSADLILAGGPVVTMGPAGVVEALAIEEGRIVAAGDYRTVGELRSRKTRVLDLAGGCAVPGFIDSHCHLLWTGLPSVIRSLKGVGSIAELKEQLAARAAAVPPGIWLTVAPGFRATQFAEGRYPTRTDLDEAAPDHPVYLPNFHMAVVNSRALAIAGVDEQTPEPDNGHIGRDADGRLDGTLHEQGAMWLVERHVPPTPSTDAAAAVRATAKAAVAAGVTSVIDAAVSDVDVAAFERLRAADDLPLRVSLLLRLDTDPEPAVMLERLRTWRHVPTRDPWLSFLGVKLFLDGAFFQGKALLSEPYSSEPDLRTQLHDAATVASLFDEAVSRGWVFGAHASGEEAVRLLLDTFDRSPSRRPGSLQVIHAHLPRPDDVGRLAAAKAVVVPQPQAIEARGDDVERLLGHERAGRLWPLRSFLAASVTVAGGSDAPIYPIDPLRAIAAAVTRTTTRGAVHEHDQRVTVSEALAMFTVQGARALKDEQNRGTLEPGKLGDVAVLSRNPLETEPDGLRELTVRATVVAGWLAYEG